MAWYDDDQVDDEHSGPHEDIQGRTILECQECRLPLNSPGIQWRICRCSLSYCVACAHGPCNSCCAYPVWGERQEKLEKLEIPMQGTQRRHEERQEGGAAGQLPRRVRGPTDIHKDRCQKREEMAARRRQDREENRKLRKDQIKAGLRPHRDRERNHHDHRVEITTVNATCQTSLQRELDDGGAIGKAD